MCDTHIEAIHHHHLAHWVIYVVEGTARYRWGDRLQHVVEAAVRETHDVTVLVEYGRRSP